MADIVLLPGALPETRTAGTGQSLSKKWRDKCSPLASLFWPKGIKHYMKSKVLIDILLLLQLDISRDRNLALIPLPTGYRSETLNLIKHFSLTTAFPGWKNLLHCVLEILFSEYPFSLKSKLWCFDRASIYFRNPVTSSWSCPSWHSNIMTVTEVLIFVFFPNFAVNMLK